MFYEVLMEKRASQEKVAVTIEDLRRAYKARVSPNLVRPAKAPRKELRRLLYANRGGKHEDGIRDMLLRIDGAKMLPKDIVSMPRSDLASRAGKVAQGMREKKVIPAYPGQLDTLKARRLGEEYYDKVVGGVHELNRKHHTRQQALPPNRRRKAPESFILLGGDPSRLLGENAHVRKVTVPKARTGEGREAFNRTVGLHEAAEMSAKRTGAPKFFSHAGVQPMLNDMNIANTFKGVGADDIKAQVGALRARELASLKGDLKFDPRSVELIEKLEGGGRISRHGRKHLDRQYKRYMSQRPPAPAPVRQRPPVRPRPLPDGLSRLRARSNP